MVAAKPRKTPAKPRKTPAKPRKTPAKLAKNRVKSPETNRQVLDAWVTRFASKPTERAAVLIQLARTAADLVDHDQAQICAACKRHGWNPALLREYRTVRAELEQMVAAEGSGDEERAAVIRVLPPVGDAAH